MSVGQPGEEVINEGRSIDLHLPPRADPEGRGHHGCGGPPEAAQKAFHGAVRLALSEAW